MTTVDNRPGVGEHRPEWQVVDDRYGRQMRVLVCDYCAEYWPCETGELVALELESLLAGAVSDDGRSPLPWVPRERITARMRALRGQTKPAEGLLERLRWVLNGNHDLGVTEDLVDALYTVLTVHRSTPSGGPSEAPYCLGCPAQSWPCRTVRGVAHALGVGVDEATIGGAPAADVMSKNW